jgi:hypothetical protein
MAYRPGPPRIIGWRKNGCPIWTIAGASPDGDPPEPKSKEGEGGGEPVSQEKLNAIAANEKKQGRAAALKEIEDILGCSPADAKKALDEFKAERDKNLTDIEKRQAEAEERDRKARELEAKAREDSLNGRIAVALARSGCFEAMDDAVALVRRRDVKYGSEDADIVKAVEDVKEKMPALFGAAETVPKTPRGVGGGKPPAAPRQTNGQWGANGLAKVEEFAGRYGIPAKSAG